MMMQQKRTRMKRRLSAFVMMALTMVVQPSGGSRVAATVPAQSEVTFEPLGRLFLGWAHAWQLKATAPICWQTMDY